MAKSADAKKDYEKTSTAGVFVSSRLTVEQLPRYVDGRAVVAYARDPQNEHVVYFATMPVDDVAELVLEWTAIDLP
ncbi:MAG: hypothetical protein SF069_03285 [Phycisphaerae bacterium]|nr:hypothetical protein [Phycisphaerae bacterium]